MGLRSYLANVLIARGRKLGRRSGCELAVDVSDHSINVAMTDPDSSDRAWDASLYKYGNVFVEGYANPIKPVIDHNQELEDPDTIDEASGHVELISSPRYREYMRQDLISQVLNPREQWKLILYAVIGLGALMLVTMVLSASAAGVF